MKSQEEPGGAGMTPTRAISRDEFEFAVDQWVIGRNGERNRAIIKRRYIDGIGFEPLAEEFDLSVSQVKRIVYKEEKKVLAHLWD